MNNNSAYLANKRVLLFSPCFFGYEEKIKSAMENAGAVVHFYDERSIKSPLSRALIKIAPFLFNKKTNRYYNVRLFFYFSYFTYCFFNETKVTLFCFSKTFGKKFIKIKYKTTR